MNILVPIDFTNISEAGLHTAIHIARQFNAKIYLFHVIGVNKPGALRSNGDTMTHAQANAEYNQFVIGMINKSKDQLNVIIKKYKNDKVEFVPVIEVGDFRDRLEDCIKLISIDLIVMGTSGEISLSEFYTGNHTAQVIRVSDKPVLAVKNEIRPEQLKTLLVITDLKKHDQKTVALVRDFAKLFKMKTMIGYLKKNRDLVLDNLFERLEHFATENNFENYSLHVIGKGGKVKNIGDFSDKNQVDVVATIEEMVSGIIRLFFGNVTEEMMGELDQPILAIGR